MFGKKVLSSGVERNRMPPRKSSMILAIAALLVLAFAMGGVYARYVQARNATGTVVAKEFYFTSDLLSKAGEEYTLNVGTASVTFELRNYADALRYAEEDISYAVYVKKGNKYLNTEYDLVEVGENPPFFANGTLKTGKTNSATITLSNLTPGTYEVTAAGNAGYEETLTATLVVKAAETGVYKYVDAEDDYFVLLTVWTEGVSGPASISYPVGLIPDNTNAAMEDAKTGMAVTDTASFASAYASHTYRFFKETVGDNGFDAEDFTVKVNEITAEKKELE